MVGGGLVDVAVGTTAGACVAVAGGSVAEAIGSTVSVGGGDVAVAGTVVGSKGVDVADGAPVGVWEGRVVAVGCAAVDVATSLVGVMVAGCIGRCRAWST
jgi:hypothetical protein